jgi:CRISPR-associated protein Cas2
MSVSKKDYVICYDISDKKRLAKIARYLEQIAFRIQRSIYLLQRSDQQTVDHIAEYIQNLIDTDADDVRIYTVKSSGYTLGCAVNLNTPFVII